MNDDNKYFCSGGATETVLKSIHVLNTPNLSLGDEEMEEVEVVEMTGQNEETGGWFDLKEECNL